MYGMSLFLWANFGYFGGLLCMFAYLLRSRQYFFYEILGRYFCELCQSQYGKILWHVTLFSETFFVFLGQSWEWFSISCRNLNIFSCYFVQKVFSLLWPSLIKKKYHAGSLFAQDILEKCWVYLGVPNIREIFHKYQGTLFSYSMLMKGFRYSSIRYLVNFTSRA